MKAGIHGEPMHPPETERWWHARTLNERRSDSSEAGAARSERLARWRDEFPDDAVFAARLGLAGLDRDGLARVLGAADRPPSDESAPAWWQWVTEAVENRPEAVVSDEHAGDGDLVRGCVRLVAPLARSARQEIQRRYRTHGHAYGTAFDADVAAGLFARSIAVELAGLASAAVVLELQAARVAGALTGTTPNERAARFLRQLEQPAQSRSFFGGNPALSRALHDRAQLAIEAGVELLERLTVDWPRLCHELLGPAPGQLTAIEPVGDPHDGGRRVTRLEFAEGATLVYKPRPVAADRAWKSLLDWLTDAGFGLPFRTARYVAGGDDHVWQEWVQTADCGDAGEVTRYYRRLGGQLALLHALQAIDTHQDNVLACAEHPVMVDLECLLHPRLGGSAAERVDPLIAETAPGCVLRVGLLPRADVAFGIDVSGMGRDPTAEVSIEETVWLDEGTDEVRMGRRTVPVPSGLNAPRLDGRLVRPHEHVDALAAGFSSAHSLLRRDCDSLLAPGGALAAFSEVAVRVILRPSRSYLMLLTRQAGEPAALADGLAREEALNALWRGARRRPDLLVAAPAEYHDLRGGDIPKITAKPGSDAGQHHAVGVLERLLSPHRVPLPDCVRRLDQTDADRQIAFLRASVTAAAGNLPEPRHRLPARTDPLRSGEIAHAAHALARRLELLALRDGPAAGWLAAVPAPGHAGRVLRPLEPGLAEGQAGVAVFLAAFARAASDDRAADLARAASRQLGALIERLPSEGLGAGSPAHQGGLIWALAQLASSLDEPGLLERALELAIDGGSAADVAEPGASSLGPWAFGLAALGAVVPDAYVLSAAHGCAARLLDAPDAPSAGMLGGRAAHALALLRLAELLDDDGLGSAAAAIVRAPTDDRDASLARGSAGRALALARLLRSERCPSTPEIEAELRHEVDDAVRNGFGRNHSLAHGDIGTLVALAEAADALGDPLLRDQARSSTGAVLASIAKLGARCAGPGAVEVPGLLSGLAGMGLGWLRLWAIEHGAHGFEPVVDQREALA